ncbi:hypothetical protein HUJ04_007177 [Dendroctonus ponderosae]|uniref:Glycoprotein-N-acetylgalactosamine 3-beta-galactosyltransferase 1 n=1 Tax=Dendroctonus ponderosae TaxID=77166 RepID=A0AAR5PJ44_DENPD|nr:hypothetical protein HUJ04_007177 [Dendroctonus ponderosae]
MGRALENRVYRRVPPAAYALFGISIGFIIGMILFRQVDTNITSFFRHNTEEPIITVVEGHEDRDHDHAINPSLAKQLYEEVRVFCWILTGPENHYSKAIHVKATWGKRCNRLIFMSTVEDSSLPSIALPVIEDRNNLWGKTKQAFKYLYEHYYDEADWFFKADDDTYTIMENMRYMLHYHNSNDPVYFGFRFKPYAKQGYMSGGAGYVLSKEALRRFVKEALPNPLKCKEDNTGAEDAEMGKCLEAVGVEAGDSRDNEGRSTFLPLFATDFLNLKAMKKDFWFWSYSYYPFKSGMDCCSDNLISVHYVSTQNMYLLEYLIYHVKPFGLSYNPNLDALVFGNQSNLSSTALTTNTKIKFNLIKSQDPTNISTSWDDYT